MIVLGVDPGSRITGYGVIDGRGESLRPLDHGRLRSDPQQEMAERLGVLASGLATVLLTHRPEVAAVETAYHGTNSRSALVLAQARGALLAALAHHGVPVVEYAPAQVKVAVTGSGRADKEQVRRMVQRLLGLGEVELPHDTSDALAVAICASQRWRLERALHGASAP